MQREFAEINFNNSGNMSFLMVENLAFISHVRKVECSNLGMTMSDTMCCNCCKKFFILSICAVPEQPSYRIFSLGEIYL